MLWQLASYFLLLALGVSAAVLLTSKKLSERLVAAGVMPRAFLSVLPVLQTIIRVFAVVLIIAGIVKIGVDTGWINAAVLSRYAFPVAIILLGVLLLVMSRRDH